MVKNMSYASFWTFEIIINGKRVYLIDNSRDGIAMDLMSFIKKVNDTALDVIICGSKNDIKEYREFYKYLRYVSDGVYDGKFMIFSGRLVNEIDEILDELLC